MADGILLPLTRPQANTLFDLLNDERHRLVIERAQRKAVRLKVTSDNAAIAVISMIKDHLEDQMVESGWLD